MTTWNPEIWTGSVRRVLFELIVKKFGPYSTWEKAVMPGRNLDDDYKNFCDLFAQVVGAKSGMAVQQQIRFAIQLANSGSATWKAQAQNAIMCKAAALEMGFISSADLPELHAKHRLPDGVTAVALDDPATLHSEIEKSVT
jgi:hypothetical protein